MGICQKSRGKKPVVKEDEVTIGYKFDYANTVNSNKWIGQGMVLKKGCLCFCVVYTIYEK